MSRVFLAEEVRLGRHVVVKVLPPEMAAGVSINRFEREIHLAAKLQHPHIVPLLTAGSDGDLLYYIMPRVEGQSLRVRLAHEHELPIPEAVRILRDVWDALAYEMLAGRPPFTAPTLQAVLAAHVSTPPDPVTKYRESVAPQLAALVMRCLAKHPADRFQSANDVLQQLEHMMTPSGGITP